MPRPAKEIFFRANRNAWYLRSRTDNTLSVRKLADFEDVEYKLTPTGRRRRRESERDQFLKELAEKVKLTIGSTEAVLNQRLTDWRDVWINQLTVRTIKARNEYCAAVSHFVAHTGDLKLGELTTNSSVPFIQAMDAKGLSRNSIRSYLRMVNIYLNFLYSKELIPKIALKTVGEEKRSVGVYSRQDMDHIQKVFEENRNRNGLRMVMMARYLGLRASEIRTLPLRHIFESSLLLRKVAELEWIPKKGKEAELPLPKPLAQFLAKDLADRNPAEMYYLDTGSGHPRYCDVSAMDKMMRPILRELGLKGLVKPLHGYRASLVTTLMNASVPMKVIAEICRHSDVRTTERYAKVEDEKIKAALALLN